MEGVGLFTTKVTFICRSPSCGGIGEPCCDGGCDFHNTCDSQNVCRGCGGRCNGCGGFPNPIYVSEPCCPYPDNGSNGLFESGCATGFVSSNATGACICNSFF
jgi:hypothetical protein